MARPLSAIVKINNPKDSEALQEEAFKHGFKWEKLYEEVRHTDRPYLIFLYWPNDIRMMYSNYGDNKALSFESGMSWLRWFDEEKFKEDKYIKTAKDEITINGVTFNRQEMEHLKEIINEYATSNNSGNQRS